ncbi:hypothetical protein HK097_002256 [Rhizophlyctis rosea]|uniref:Uncharacterized protein n=1 Tax=Rhizophlyctis rosea TaxID=64517 RepID=A0AAD5X0A0_9FUNG|nr:hypothetical protein HK097_002256 [Rhizophlyctis rosea]
MCYDILPAKDTTHPTTFTEQNRHLWTDWPTQNASWPQTLTIKHIRVIKTHTWSNTLKQNHALQHNIPTLHFTERYLYHGTPEHNINSILTNGFNTATTYLAQSPTTSLPYMRGGNKLILSSVLVRMANEGDGPVSVVREAKRIVPVAVIELRMQPVGLRQRLKACFGK